MSLWDNMGIYGSQWEIIALLSIIYFFKKLSESYKPGFVSKF